MAANANDSSSVGGSADEITSLKATSANISVMKGQTVDLKKYLLAFCGSNKLCENDMADYEFSISDPNLAFSLDETDGTITADETSGTATVTVKANSGKAKTSLKVTAKAVSKANTFSFEKTSYVVPVKGSSSNDDVAEDFTIKLVAPEGTIFTDAQKDAITSYFFDEADDFDKAWGLTDTAKDFSACITPTGSWDSENPDSVYNITYSGADLNKIEKIVKQSADGGSNKKTIRIDFPKASGNSSVIAKTLNISTEKAVVANKIASTGSTITIAVGETKNIADKFRFGPSDANIKTEVTYSTDYATDSASYDDYAKVDDKGNITGVAVGTNKVVCTLNDNGKSASITVKVVKAGEVTTADTTPKIKLALTEIEVGAFTSVELTGVEEDATVTWKISDSAIADISPLKGITTKAYAKKAGTAKITAMVDGEEVATATLTVKDIAGTSSTPPTTSTIPGFTPNPQTGDSFFANLF